MNSNNKRNFLKEYIVISEEDELFYNSFDYHELIHCEDPES